jgi:hypothetical protein
MDTNAPKLRPSIWAFVIGGLFTVSAAALLVGKVFFAWAIDSVAAILFLMIWIPAVLPLIRRLKYKDFVIEFIERSVEQVQADVADLANKTEIEKEKGKLKINVDPYKIRLKYTSDRIDAKFFRVKVWLDAPTDFLAQVTKVVFERHPTFKNRFKEVTSEPFKDSFRCWGEFTIRSEITLKTGDTLRRQRFLRLRGGQSETSEVA